MSLSDLPLLFLDCQTTGIHPRQGSVIELGWARASAAEIQTRGTDAIPIEGSLCALPTDALLPSVVRGMTGIEESFLADAPFPIEVWKRLAAQIESPGPGPVPCAIHYARFETPFLEALHAELSTAPFPLEILCLHQLAKRCLPGLPANTIRAASGYFGCHLGEAHRTTPHVQASLAIWLGLLPLLPKEIDDWSSLLAWTKEKPDRPKKSRIYRTPREKRLALPASPGVYRMASAQGKILYVGKATNLNSRVNSYFRTRTNSGRARLPELMSQVHDIDVTATETSLEAALLENDEIKRWDPIYNASLKARARSLTFCNRDFLQPSPSPDTEFRHGPFSSFFPFDELNAALHLLTTGEDEFGVFSYVEEENLSRETIRQGRTLFLEQHNPLLTAAGLILWGKKNPEVLDRLEEEADEEEDPLWTADDVLHSLERKIARVGRLVRRSRWICRLTDATVGWETKQGWRWLEWQGAQIRDRGYAQNSAALPLPSTWKSPLELRQQTLDLTAFDRLGVLVGELRRLLKKGTRMRLRLTPRFELDEARLLSSL